MPNTFFVFLARFIFSALEDEEFDDDEDEDPDDEEEPDPELLELLLDEPDFTLRFLGALFLTRFILVIGFFFSSELEVPEEDEDDDYLPFFVLRLVVDLFDLTDFADLRLSFEEEELDELFLFSFGSGALLVTTKPPDFLLMTERGILLFFSEADELSESLLSLRMDLL